MGVRATADSKFTFEKSIVVERLRTEEKEENVKIEDDVTVHLAYK